MAWRREYSWGVLLCVLLFVIVAGLWVISGSGQAVPETDSDLPIITQQDPVLGPADASVVIVLFSEFDCAGCTDLWLGLQTMREEFPSDLAIVWKDFPNTSLRPNSLPAALAARCAGEDGLFFEFANRAYASNDLSLEGLTAIGVELGFRENRFASCIEDQTHVDAVQAGFEEGLRLNIAGTPTFYVNGKRYTGQYFERDLRDLIRAELSP